MSTSVPVIEYLKAVAPGLFESRQKVREWLDPWALRQRVLSRGDLIRKYAWSIPTHEALLAIAGFARQIVEIGAGTGYWAHLLQTMGVTVVCYDEAPPREGANSYEHSHEWTTIQQGDVSKVERHPDCALMLSWPPYDDPMAHDALRHYIDVGGTRLVYIGEGPGGCTGNDAFHGLVHEQMKEVRRIDLPQWYGIHDALWLYETTDS